MKKVFVNILVITSCMAGFSQTQQPAIIEDTTRIVELREVTITSTQKTAKQQLINFFKANSSVTLEEILSRLPEISLLRRGSYGMEPSIRSFTGGQINVLVDGMRIHGACADKMDPATIYIEPINLENLQVQTAITGFMSGSAIGGTVNMKMAEPDFLNVNKITGLISSGYQTAAKSFYESARLNYSTGKWAFRMSGTYRNNKNYRSGGGDIIDFSQYEKVNYSISAKYQHTLYTYFKADLLGDDGWNIGYPALPMDVGYAAARIGSLSMHRENPSKSLYKWQVKIYANKIDHSMDDTKRPNVPMHMDMPGWSKTYGAYTEAELKINQKQRLLLRADGSSTFLKASMTMYQPGELPMYMLTWPDNRKNQSGISAAWLLQIDSTLKLQVTGRTDFISYKLVSQEAKDQVSIFGYPSANRKDLLKNISAVISKIISQKIKVSASIAYVERMPTASELYGFYLFNSNDGYDYIGNPKLKIEKSLQADLSVIYNWKNNRVQLSYFYSSLFDYLTGTINSSFSTMTIGAKGVKEFINIPNASVSGVEGSVVLKPAPAIDVVSTVRYTAGKDNKGNSLPLIAPLKNTTSIRYQPKNFSVQLEAEAASKQGHINIEAGEDVTTGYSLLHIRFGYNTMILNNTIELQGGVENIFDRKYHEHLDWGNISRPGRNVYIQFRVYL
ncbi:MAG TPA: TonB-dependent receptor [Chitinophagaceae bacterium]|nr:TonB-dependent receptor [Chitinophagaceae bacterium]